MRSIYEPFGKTGFSFSILQASGNVVDKIGSITVLLKWLIMLLPPFKKIPERSEICGALAPSKKFNILNTLAKLWHIKTFPSNYVFVLVIY